MAPTARIIARRTVFMVVFISQPPGRSMVLPPDVLLFEA
jgi:hypothetical protein